MSRTKLPSIEQSYSIIVARLSEQRSQRNGSIGLLHHKLGLTGAISRSQENPRLEIPQLFRDMVIECLNEYLPGSCAESVFNVDEVGISEWERPPFAKRNRSRPMTDQTIRHGIHHNLKIISVKYCA
jgi:hypothetical protein